MPSSSSSSSSSSSASEATRQTKLTIDLGGEQVNLERIEATESLSRPFTIIVDLIAPLGELDLLPHLGKGVTVSLSQDDEHQRYFHGLAVEGEFVRESPEGFHHRLVLQPWSHALSHNRDFAIYQELNALDIIKAVLSEAGMSDVDYTKLSASLATRTYCVQYGESDFAFISRLMEEEGIYYFYRHEKQRHVMVLCDSPSSHVDGKPAQLTYNPLTASLFNTDSAARTEKARKHFLQSWIEKVSTRHEAKVTTRDFNFEKPQRPLETKAEERKLHPKDSSEVYLYPGGYTDERAGKRLGTVVLDSLRAERRTYSGQSQASGLSCGTKLKVVDHPVSRLDGSYLITRTYHSITAERYRSGGGQGEDPFNVILGAVPADIPWQAPQVSPRPVVHGLESAIVTGPQGEEIYTDEYGRVKVRFHWDRSNSEGQKSTCWIRVSQTGGLGNIILPRVGHEVLVDFLGGDPDRPVVVGRVFNQANKPSYQLPDNKTVATWRTMRYGAAGDYGPAKAVEPKYKPAGPPPPGGANEMRFEDKGGSEEVYLYAERDLNTRVRHNETHHVGADQEIKVFHDRTELVDHDETVKVTNDRKVNIGNNDSLDITGKLTIKAGTTIEIEAGTSITLKVGMTTVKLDACNIKMESTMVATTGKATVDVKSPMTTVKGDGMLTLKGGMTMIN